MSQFETAGHEVVDRDVKTTGNGAYVSVPKRWLGENGVNRGPAAVSSPSRYR